MSFKPVMQLSRRTEISLEIQGPFKELYDVLTSNLKQCQKGELSQSEICEAKRKLLSKQTEWKKFSHLKPQHIFRNQLIPNTKNQKKTLIWRWRKQLPFGRAQIKRRNTVTCSPNEQQKLSSQSL